MDQTPAGTSVTTAPPPPSEVKIRTMKSDIAMMAASGGGLPRFESIKVAGLATRARESAESKQDVASTAARTESKSNLILIVVLVAILAALVVVGWLIYQKLF